MTEIDVDANENAKCGLVEVDWRFACWSSPDGRRAAHFTDRNFWLLDLFHMTKKKFSISSDRLPASLKFCLFQAFHWFHDKNAFVVIKVFDERTRTYELYSAIMNIDHDRSRCVLRDVRLLIKELDRLTHHICKLIALPDALGIVLISNDRAGHPTSLHVFSNLPDGESKWTERTINPDNFCPMGLLNGVIYGFLLVDDFRMDCSKLVKVCLETNEQTTLDVEVLVKNKTFWWDSSWIWSGRKLITNPEEQSSDRDDSRSRLLIFDVDLLRWSHLKWEFEDPVEELISDRDNTLIVITRSSRNGVKTNKIYRFAINRPDSLANSSWMAIWNHAKKSPGFDRHVQTLLPKNSPFHCALNPQPSKINRVLAGLSDFYFYGGFVLFTLFFFCYVLLK